MTDIPADTRYCGRCGVIADDALKRFRRFIEVEKRDLKRGCDKALKKVRDIHEVTA